MAFELLKVGARFPSWEAVEAVIKELEEVNFFPLRFGDKKSISSYNKAVFIVLSCLSKI
jgi:hypothetical protein